MGIGDKILNKAEKLKGKGKVAGGRATNDSGLQAKGKATEKKAGLRQAGEKVKDVFKK